VTTILVEQFTVHGPETEIHGENAEVLPFVSVAVAVKLAWPAGLARIIIKETKPLPSVVRLVAPRKTCPSPKPLPSQEALLKNSRRYTEFVPLLSEPPSETLPKLVAALVRTGLVCELLAPDTRLIPRPPLAKMELDDTVSRVLGPWMNTPSF
jgi:hypothetical protein